MVQMLRLAFAAGLLGLSVGSPFQGEVRGEAIKCPPDAIDCPVTPHPTNVVIGRAPQTAAPTSSATAPIFYCDADPCYEGEVCCFPHGCFPASEGCPKSYMAPRALDIAPTLAVNISCDGEICDSSKYTCCPPHGCCPRANALEQRDNVICMGQVCEPDQNCCADGCRDAGLACPLPTPVVCQGKTCEPGQNCCADGCRDAGLECPVAAPTKRDAAPVATGTTAPAQLCGTEICPSDWTCCGPQYGCRKSKFCPL